MRTRLFTLLLVLTTAMMAQAQSLTGKIWATMMGEESTKVVLKIGFIDDRCFAQVIYLGKHTIEGETLTSGAQFGVEGPYTLNNNILNIKFDIDHSEFAYDVSIEGGDESTKGVKEKLMKASTEDKTKKMIIDLVTQFEKCTIKQLTETRLVLDNVVFQLLPEE